MIEININKFYNLVIDSFIYCVDDFYLVGRYCYLFNLEK